MKVYTEVNYIWKDDKLVQTDSKSYEYEGEVDLCHWYHRHSTTVSVPSVTPKITIPKVTLPKVKIPTINEVKEKIPTINEVKEIVSKGPTGGTPKDIADALYGGSTKEAVENVQETYVAAENSFNETKDDVTQALFAPVKKKLEETATSLINENAQNGGGGGGGDDELLYGSRRGMQMQGEGQRASSGGLRRNIHELRTLSGKAKPKG